MSFRLSGTPQTPEYHYIPFGDAGIYETVGFMRRMKEQGKADLEVRALVASILRTTPATGPVGISKALTAWFRRNIAYRQDDGLAWQGGRLLGMSPQECRGKGLKDCEDVEMLYAPRQVLMQRFGDCDDFAATLGAMHEIAGIQTRFVIVAVDGNYPGQFSHVYFQAKLDGEWVPVDPVNRQQFWGWEVPDPQRKQIIY